MASVPTFVVIPTFGRECLAMCLASLAPQVDHIFVIKTEPFELMLVDHDRGTMIEDYSRPKNISRWWNLGIDAAAARAKSLGATAWNTLVVNDDVIAPPHLINTLHRAMRLSIVDGRLDFRLRGQRPVVAYPDNFGGDRLILNQKAGPVEITTRMSGWCFMIRGESGLRTDETFEWWYGDDDLDWTARQMGGALMVPGCKVDHLYPGETTSRDAALTARTHVDRQLFERKWSGVPH